MDRPIDLHDYQPTLPDNLNPLDPAELATLFDGLRIQTRHIAAHPYDPNTWLQRGITLMKLRYPELAVGDGYKAGLLAGEALKGLGDGKWGLGARMGFWMLLEDDEAEEDGWEREMLRRYLDGLQRKARELVEQNLELWPAFEEGRFRRRKYPWMPPEFASRGDEVLRVINDEFKDNGGRALRNGTGQICSVRRHAFGVDPNGEKPTHDVLGVFATREIAPDSTILIDQSRIWGCNGPGAAGSLENLNGGMGCGEPIHPNLPSEDTSLDLRWIRAATGKNARCSLVFMRALLCAIQDGGVDRNSLSHPLIARLTPCYPAERIHRFSLANDIALPHTFLRTQGGVDIFANPFFDTWVFSTISSRILSNSCGDPLAECLSPLFSLFNHSCEPNVRWELHKDHRTVVVRSVGRMRAGEQLFVEYDAFLSGEGVGRRREGLWRWLEGPCGCGRCLREEEEEEGRRVDEKMEGVELGKGKEWDGGEKPVL
ncbi:uncharacterized protein LTR77_005072 [Saxophila tyrrhenica]|uniref:SET domain-containing protein n=1 Tax=Saxophila tyrrhenica TaxID=1690608 RepID=A0AAV9PB76_9PEZI|nr:hypothetical protein LTR77_005072 [Saxophila tyrrhenica]